MRFTLRRRLCRATFCTLCVLPTLVVGSAAVLVNTPAYQTAKTTRWQSQLSARLGLDVNVARVVRNGDRQFVVHGIELLDPESHICLARARSAAVTLTETGSIVTVGQPELDFQRLPRLVEVLHEHLLLRTSATDAKLQLSSPTLVLLGEAGSESVLDVRFVLEAEGDGTEAFVEFRSTDAEDGGRVRLRVVRNRQLSPPATGWELHTGNSELPCTLVRAWLPQLDQLGAACSFRGSVWAERLTGGWEAEVSGVFRQLDLTSLVSRFPHKLSGVAELALTRLIVHRGQIVEARGQLCSPAGGIGQTLVHAAESHLKLKRYAPSTAAKNLSYCDLFVQFALDENGLVIAGHDDPYQTVLADFQGPLLTAQDAGPVPPQALVKLLVPATELQVPAAREAAALLQALPLPAVKHTGPVNARLDVGPLRLRRE